LLISYLALFTSSIFSLEKSPIPSLYPASGITSLIVLMEEAVIPEVVLVIAEIAGVVEEAGETN
jgi:hypothetical protein